MLASATDIFLSYKAEDRARLEPLVDALEAEGFSVWWDAQIGGGANWQEEIEKHLDGAKCVIVAWSKRSIGPGGQFVREEARRAQRRGAYLPICLDGVEPPLGFGEFQALPLKGWRGNRSDPRFQAISDAVRSRVPANPVPATEQSRQRLVSRRSVIAGGVGVAAVATAGGTWFFLKPEAANAKRIAVLPFANLSGAADQAYFAEGVAEELRAALARIGMEVIGRTSSDAVKDEDARTAASKLDVANILIGSVRRSADTIRVSAQLVSGTDGVERWGQTYDRPPGDAIKIQTDIAQNVAQALSLTLGKAGRAALTLGGTTDPVAQDLVLQAWQALNRADSFDSLRRALGYADAAIARDPGYAGAYVARSVISREWANSARTVSEGTKLRADASDAARKAIALAPRWGNGYATLAQVEMAQLDFASALRISERAVALSPEDPTVVISAASIVGFVQDVGAGIALADRAIALDPLRAAGYATKAFLLTYARRYREAIPIGQKALSLRPEEISNHAQIGDAFLLLGQTARAKAEYEATNEGGIRSARLAILAARTGDRAGALKQIDEMKRAYGDGTSYQHAEIYAQLGDVKQALTELDAAFRWGDGGLVYLKFDPFLDPIRSDPGYATLLKKLNFP